MSGKNDHEESAGTTSSPQSGDDNDQPFANLCLSDGDECRSDDDPQRRQLKRLKKLQRRIEASRDFKPVKTVVAHDGTRVSLFFTRAYCFSNHFTPKGLFHIDGVEYCCVEQFYMFYKATVFGDTEAAEAIMRSDDAGEMKRIGSAIIGFDRWKWRRVGILVMLAATLKKYEQNADLREQLLETGNSVIGEANHRDWYWGIGLGLNDFDATDPVNWRGKNVLGTTLMFVREKLRARGSSM